MILNQFQMKAFEDALVNVLQDGCRIHRDTQDVGRDLARAILCFEDGTHEIEKMDRKTQDGGTD